MIRSSACQQWHADQSGPRRRATATKAASYTTPWDMIHNLRVIELHPQLWDALNDPFKLRRILIQGRNEPI
jgi:hypothetical protein